MSFRKTQPFFSIGDLVMWQSETYPEISYMGIVSDVNQESGYYKILWLPPLPGSDLPCVPKIQEFVIHGGNEGWKKIASAI